MNAVNPNFIVPTAPAGDRSNRAASTSFVGNVAEILVNPAAALLFATPAYQAAVPSVAAKEAINTAIDRLTVVNPAWGKHSDWIEDIYFFGVHDATAALLSALNPAQGALTLVNPNNALSFVPGRGYDSTGSTGNYLSGKLITALAKYKQDDCFAFTLPDEDLASDNPDFGTFGDTGSFLQINSRTSTNQFRVFCNSATAHTQSGVDSGYGLGWCGRDPGSTGNVQWGIGDVAFTAVADASVPLTARTFSVFRSSGVFSSRRLSAVGYGKWPAGGAAQIADFADIMMELRVALRGALVVSPLPLRVLRKTTLSLRGDLNAPVDGSDASSYLSEALDRLVEIGGGTIDCESNLFYIGHKATKELNNADIVIRGHGENRSGFYTDNGDGVLALTDSGGAGSLNIHHIGFFAAATPADNLVVPSGVPLIYSVAGLGPARKLQAFLEHVHFGPKDASNSSLQTWTRGPVFAQVPGGNDVAPRRIYLRRVDVDQGNAVTGPTDQDYDPSTAYKMADLVCFGQSYGPRLENCLIRGKAWIGVSRVCNDQTPEGGIFASDVVVSNCDIGYALKASDTIAAPFFQRMVGAFIYGGQINVDGICGVWIDGSSIGVFRDVEFQQNVQAGPPFAYSDFVFTDAIEMMIDNCPSYSTGTPQEQVRADPNLLSTMMAACNLTGNTNPGNFRRIQDITHKVGRYGPIGANCIASYNAKRTSNYVINLPTEGTYDNGATVPTPKIVDDTGSATVTFSITANELFVEYAGHGFADKQPVMVSTTGTLPSSLTPGIVYYVIANDANSFALSATKNGSHIVQTGGDTGTGTHSVTAFDDGKVFVSEALITEATAANLASSTSYPNSNSKFKGKLIWDSTNLRALRARGSNASDPWDPVSIPPAYASLAALVAANPVPTVILRVYVNGYAAAGDGGDAHWRRVQSIPSHPCYRVAADGSIWELDEPSVDVRMTGAVADGNPTTYAGTNNTPFINNAILYANAKGGGEVVIPTGYFVVQVAKATDPGGFSAGCINLESVNYVRLRAMPGGWLLQASNNNTHGEHVVLAGFSSNLEFIGLKVDGNRANGNTGAGFHCIRTGACSFVTIRDCFAKSSESYAISCQTYGTYAFNNTDGANNIEFFNSDALWTKGTGWSIGGGVASSDGSQTTTSDLARLDAGLSPNTAYSIVFDITAWTAGTITPVVGGVLGTPISGAGTFYQQAVTSGPSDTTFALRASDDFVGSIDNVSVLISGGVVNHRIEDCIVDDAGADGYDMHNLSQQDDKNYISRCTVLGFNKNSTGSKAGIHFRGKNISVEDCTVGGDGGATAGIAGIAGGNGEAASGQIITNCKVDLGAGGTSVQGIIGNNPDMIIADNQVTAYANHTAGVQVAAGATGSLIEGNKIKGPVTVAGVVALAGADDCRIQGNSTVGSAADGYSIFANNTSLNGNTARNCTGYAARVDIGATGTLIRGLDPINCTAGRLAPSPGPGTIDYDAPGLTSAVGSAGPYFAGVVERRTWPLTPRFSILAIPDLPLPLDLSLVNISTQRWRVNSKRLLENVGANRIRHQYDPVSGKYLGWLIEATSDQNLLPNSEDATAWTNAAVTPTADTAISPDGTTHSDSLVPSTSNTNHTSSSTFVGPTTGQSYYFAVWVKLLGSYNRFALALVDSTTGANNVNAQFNVSTGAIDRAIVAGGTFTAGLADIEAFPNGLYRCWMSGKASSFAGNLSARVCPLDATTNFATASGLPSSFAGDGTSGIIVWGRQLGLGDRPSSYIQTTGVAVTRNADVLTYAGTDFTQWFNPAEGTLYADFSIPHLSAAVPDWIFAFDDGTANNQFGLRVNTSHQLEYSRTIGGSNALLTTGTVSRATPVHGAAYDIAGAQGVSLAGAAAVTGTGASFPSGITRFTIPSGIVCLRALAYFDKCANVSAGDLALISA